MFFPFDGSLVVELSCVTGRKVTFSEVLATWTTVTLLKQVLVLCDFHVTTCGLAGAVLHVSCGVWYHHHRQ